MPADRTPEQRAREIAEQYVMPGYAHSLAVAIASAIRSAVSENNEACASQASVAGDMMARLAKDHPKNSPHRDRCNARAREAYGIAYAIRSRGRALGKPNHEEPHA